MTTTDVTPYARNGFILTEFWSDSEFQTIKENTFSQIYGLLDDWMEGSWDKYPLEQYHVWSQELGIPHDELFTSANRHFGLTGQFRDTLLNSNVINILKELGVSSFECTAGPGHEPGKDPLGFRIARPSREDAVHLHAESWYGGDVDSHLNLWLPVLGFDENATLPLVPGSHVKDYPTSEPSEKFRSKMLDYDESNLNIIRPKFNPGMGVIFHSNLLHGGAVNLSDVTRISLEVRFIPEE